MIYQLNGIVRNELSLTPHGSIEPAYDSAAAMLAEEAKARENPAPAPAERGVSNEVPF